MSGRGWAVGGEEFKRALAGRRGSVPARRPDIPGADEQMAMTRVVWDASRVPFDRIGHSTPERARARFRASIPDLIWNAAALEGNSFTLPEVRTLLDGVTVGGQRIEDERQILALSKGYSLVDELVRDDAFALDKSTSDRIHSLVALHEAIESGHFRGEGSVTGGSTVNLLVSAHEDLLRYLHRVEDARERALAYFASATRRQYYFDGNKRTARLMMAGELLREGFDAVNIPFARRLEFNIALDRLFSTDDATELMAFIATCAPSG